MTSVARLHLYIQVAAITVWSHVIPYLCCESFVTHFKFVYKICTKSEWQDIKRKSQLTGSKKDLEDGYIHFSGQDQVEGTLKKFYQNQKDLILLKVDTLKLDHLVWEQASDGTMFPHLYSLLDISNVVDEFDIVLSDDGTHILPAVF